jgi:large repetitive protein
MNIATNYDSTLRSALLRFCFCLIILFLMPIFSAVAQPGIRSFTPTTTSPGSSIVLTGIGFTGASALTIGGTPAASYTINSDTQITAIVACNNASGEVVVTTRAGTGRLAGFTFVPAS